MSDITDFSSELAKLGFTQKSLEMQFLRKGGAPGYIRIHQVPNGFRVSFSDWGESSHATVKKLDLASILGILPDWVVEKLKKRKGFPKGLST